MISTTHLAYQFPFLPLGGSLVPYKMAELLLDSEIRFWVFLPIVIITFLIGILRHYVTILLSSEKKVELSQITDR